MNKKKGHNLSDFKCKRIEINGDERVYKGRKIVGWAQINFNGQWEHIETYLYKESDGIYRLRIEGNEPDGWSWDWACHMDEARAALYKEMLLDDSEWGFNTKRKYLFGWIDCRESSKTKYRVEIQKLP